MIITSAQRADAGHKIDAAGYKMKEDSENSEGLREETDTRKRQKVWDHF